jgi:hypothetical protein
MTHLRFVLTGILLSVAALTAAVAETRMDNHTPGHSDLQGPYVVLGDSYSSGPRIPAQTGKPAGCDRSDHNYPALLADQVKLKGGMFRDMSCSGATTADPPRPPTRPAASIPACRSPSPPTTTTPGSTPSTNTPTNCGPYSASRPTATFTPGPSPPPSTTSATTAPNSWTNSPPETAARTMRGGDFA